MSIFLVLLPFILPVGILAAFYLRRFLPKSEKYKLGYKHGFEDGCKSTIQDFRRILNKRQKNG